MIGQENHFIVVPEKYVDRVLGNYNPVVIVTTRNKEGQANAAPFAMCMEVCHDPPMLAFGVGRGKDTLHNVQEHGEFVVNIAGIDMLDKLMITAGRYPPDINELEKADLHELPGIKVDVPRIKECKLHFECRVEWIKAAGDHFIVLGGVVKASADKDILTENFRVKFESLKPVHYVGKGTNKFLEIGKMFSIKLQP